MDEDIRLEIFHKATKGIFALVGRTALLQLVGYTAWFVLPLLVDISTIGIFYIVSSFVNFFGYFSDIGLAAALVQKKEQLTHEDLRTTFTIQQALVVVLVIVGLLFSPVFASFYGLKNDGLFLLQALIISFFLSSLKTIPSILLERELNFQKLVIPQIVETLVFYATVVYFAYRGWGITSFTLAVLLRGVSGLIAIYIIRPWLPSFGLDKSVAKRLMRFGLPFQLNSVLALVKDDLFTVFLGKLLTFTQIGYIGWAKKWAEVPLRLIMENIVRVTFPSFARLQHDKTSLTKAIEKTLFFLALFVTPFVLEMIFFIKPFMMLIPKYDRLQPALLSFYLFALSTIFSAVSSPLINALNAIGEIKITLRFMVVWTILTWAIIPLFILLFGFSGVALGILVISGTVVFVVKIAQRYAPFSLYHAFSKPTIISSILFIFLLASSMILTPFTPTVKILVSIVGGLSIYALASFIFVKQELLSLAHKILHAS